MNRNDRIAGCLIGLACGDAVGATLEFQDRGTFEPISDMIGGGPFNLRPGEWTDDTSMALCLASSLIGHRGFNAHDQMLRYVQWYQTGYMSSTGRCFDIGGTVLGALRSFGLSGEPYSGPIDEFSAGNGSIMRLGPIPMFYSDWADAIYYSGESSRTTHGAKECIAACQLLGSMLHKAINGQPKEEILFGKHFPQGSDYKLPMKINAIANGDYTMKDRDSIRGSGYVVQSLEAALWCFYSTGSYKAAILEAANLGDDADTTGAICGQIAGAYYGRRGIPELWQKRLAKLFVIEGILDGLLGNQA